MQDLSLPASEFGALQNAIWTEQFEALRDGDRFFYLNDPTLEYIEVLYGVSHERAFKDIIVDNTALTSDNLSDNVFQVPTESYI